MKKLYPPIEPYKTELLPVSKIHTLYLEQSGNPDGKPVIYLHGGPGCHTDPDHRQFFNPKKYRIILFDQRGCGKSIPFGELKENTTWELVEDMEKIRKHLKINKWMLFGGSWGSCLALAYAEKYLEKVTEMILEGIFTFRKWEIEWFTEKAKIFYPDLWDKAIKNIPDYKGEDIRNYLSNLYTGEDEKKALRAIKAFNIWNQSLLNLVPKISKSKITKDVIIGEKIMYHYINNNGFMKEGEILKNAYKLKKIPTVIIQGRYDMTCPPITAWELHKALPNSSFHILPLAGHKADDQGMVEKLVEYTDKFS